MLEVYKPNEANIVVSTIKLSDFQHVDC